MPVICIGELTVDWLALNPGQSLAEAGSFFRCLGGNASNVAIGLSRLGTPARLVARVGADVDGVYLRKTLGREGVDIEHVLVDESRPTAQCYCLTAADGEHAYYNFPRQNASEMLTTSEISEEIFAGARFLHATGISFTAEPRRTAVALAMDTARRKGLTVCFDGSFPTADILKVNLSELLFWAGISSPGSPGDDPAAAAESLRSRYGLKLVAATLGEKGSLLATTAGTFACPPLPVTCVDSIGAGDGFIAGLLHALGTRLSSEDTADALAELTGPDWLAIGRTANAVGAMATTRLGAWTGLPRAAELAPLLAAP